MTDGLYIHIPFCHQICNYCDFNKVFFKNQPVDGYLDALGEELRMMEDQGIFGEGPLTIFIGGGTPTALSVGQLEKLFDSIARSVPKGRLIEFSTEANPDELTPDKLALLKEKGVGRLSIGVQSFDEGLLRRLGRTHGPADAERVVRDARDAGFENLSIDLMYGLPGQTIEQWEDTLDRALALDLPHYSAYSLIVEPKTVFYNLMNKNLLPLPGEDTEADMFRMLMERMEQKGIRQYEISNFAVDGFQSVHNKLYWQNRTYAGAGAGAHGYSDGVRYSNHGPLKKYMNAVAEGRRPVFETHNVTPEEEMEEEMFLGLRMIAGVSADEFRKRFGREVGDVYGKQIRQLEEEGLLSAEDGRIRLTDKGVFLGNEVFARFIG
ncbi:radical SAM family heme chaperone HemW [Edaphobacillus lindanitolerans]|uniref:Heme chaperone HemW n=1 Tax=Edaphobacillus lindanitolerans TaxID=550447 RepID=A0A1U7PQ17_9BACI|nr:radical SAM family heme chaperone HemW [Edaphobacillus lindanitolerans]SIT82478.1 oxygen-independent coproporphyrinogen-3 oxidase [Edaphobacillus lindanitolerans]